MTKEKTVYFRKIYKILLSASIIIAGISLIVGCVTIYFSGNGYSRQLVASTFSKINIPVYLCLALIIGDIIWELLSPTDKDFKSVKKIKTENKQPTDSKHLFIIKLCILGVAIIALIGGFLAGGYNDVLTKAVNICTECIGLG